MNSSPASAVTAETEPALLSPHFERKRLARRARRRQLRTASEMIICGLIGLLIVYVFCNAHHF